MDNTIINKAASINRCLKRIREEYFGHEDELETNFTKQDSIILNLQRACESAIDLGTYVVRKKNLGIPQTSRDVFAFLEKEKVIPTDLSQKLQSMVGFRNTQEINIEIVRSIIETRLEDFEKFISVITPQTHSSH